MPQPSSPAPKSKIDNLPVIKNWKPAPIFSALGVLIGGIVWIILASCIGTILACVIQTIAVIIYSLVFYRSYFTEKPRLTSSKGISFLNYAIPFYPNIVSSIFGVLWNRNLKRSHDEKDPWIGVSHIVVIVYFFALVGFAAWYAGTPHMMPNGDGSYTMTQPAANSAQGSSSSAARQNQKSTPQQITIPGTNSQITIPGDWEYQIKSMGDDSLNDVLILRPSSTKEYTGLMVGASDVSQAVDEYTRQYGSAPSTETIGEDAVLEQNRLNMDSVESEAAELVEIGGIEYWKAQTEGTYSGAPRTNILYSCFTGTNVYAYILLCTDESDETNEALAADLDQIVASASYQ